MDIDVGSVKGSAHGDGGVRGGTTLLRFTEAMVGGDDVELSAARKALEKLLGPDVVVDTAAVAAAFQMMNRVANATGTPLDATLEGLTAGIREQLEFDYPSTNPGQGSNPQRTE
ncbi:MAG: hypothetical protein ACPHJY_09525 [Acidimicrobiales bacterium]